MRHYIYVAVLAFCLLGTAPLEVFLRTRVYARPLRLALTLAPVVIVFVAWDLYAISRHHWTYDHEQTTAVLLPGRLPLDELLFFLVIPICAVLTLEAVRAVKGWTVGDEAPQVEEPGVSPEEPAIPPAGPPVDSADRVERSR